VEEPSIVPWQGDGELLARHNRDGPEFGDLRAMYQSCYQAPVRCTWADLVDQGAINGGNGLVSATNGAPTEGDTV
jgi:hypothetical protein